MPVTPLTAQSETSEGLWVNRVNGTGEVSILVEKGDMTVGKITADDGSDGTSETVTLTTQNGNIIDAYDDVAAPVTNITTTDLYLYAMGGGVGTRSDEIINYLDLNLRGTVSVDAQTDVHLNEVDGDLVVASIRSADGDVYLRAAQNILSAGSSSLNIEAGDITLEALGGTVGSDASYLKLDQRAGGLLTSWSAGDAWLHEVDGDMQVNTVKTGYGSTGIVYLQAEENVLNANLVKVPGDYLPPMIDELESKLWNIVSQKAHIVSGENIGAADKALETDISYLEAISGGSIWLTEEGTLTIGQVILDNPVVMAAAAIVLTTRDDFKDAGEADDLIVDTGAKVVSTGGDVTLRGGDDIHIRSGGTVSAAGTVTLHGDYDNADDHGTNITIHGSLGGTDVVVQGDSNKDVITFELGPKDSDGNLLVPSANDRLTGNVQVLGGEDEDLITIVRMHSRLATESMLIDGEDATDAVHIFMSDLDLDGSRTDYEITVSDSGAADDGVDTLTIEGLGMEATAESAVENSDDPDDIFLIRKSFIARLHGDVQANTFQDEVERINYDRSINGRVRINAWGGNDSFITDDTSAIMTLDGGRGNDSFQIGQVFGDDPNVVSGVAAGDEIDTTQITRGYLSYGNSEAMVLYGGEDEDIFTVYSNKAELRMEGEDGNDEFIIRAFVAEGDLILDAGEGDDRIDYNINAPVSINGGAGFDTVVALGTEKDDTFVITKDGISGAGLNISVDGVEEAIEVDGLEGDDTFFIMSTRENVVNTVIGGLGSDSFIVTGDVTERVVSADLEGLSGTIGHGSVSNDDEYDGLLVDGVGLNIASEVSGSIVITESDGLTRVIEDSTNPAFMTDSYDIELADFLKLFATDGSSLPDGAKVTITISAALSSSQDRRDDNGNETGAGTVQLSLDGGATWQDAHTIVFDKDNWDDKQTITVRATSDLVVEGERKVTVSHSVIVETDDTSAANGHVNYDAVTALDGYRVRNVAAYVVDNDAGSLIITPTDNSNQVLEGAVGAGGISDTYTIQLAVKPTGTVTIHLSEVLGAGASGQLQLSDTTITFDESDWDQPKTITVTAVDDSVRENRLTSKIGYTVTSSADSRYDGLEVADTAFEVIDNDSAGVLVTESEGSTLVSKGGGTSDDYSLRLTKEPADDVLINIASDGTTDTVLGGRVVLNELFENTHSVLFGSTTVNHPDGSSWTESTITRTDGKDWAEDGYRVGMWIQLDGSTSNDVSGGSYYKIQSIDGAVLNLTSSVVLVDSSTAETVTVKAVNPAVSFNTSNWYTDVQVNVVADDSFKIAPGSEYDKYFPQTAHTTSKLAGPVVIEGGTTQKDRSLKIAVMLPSENPTPPKELDITTDETVQTDQLIIFNDSSVSDDTGTMTSTNISGLGMAADAIDVLDKNNIVERTVPGGINYVGLEVVELLMGAGNDTFTLNTDALMSTSTETGSITFDTDAVTDNAVMARETGSWFGDGYRIGDTITVAGSANNDGQYPHLGYLHRWAGAGI